MNDNFYGATFIICMSIIVAGAIGWVMNIVSIINMASVSPAENVLFLVFRVCGVFFAPLGAVLGYI